MAAQVDREGGEPTAEGGDLVEPHAMVAAEAVDEEHRRRPGLPGLGAIDELVEQLDVSDA